MVHRLLLEDYTVRWDSSLGVQGISLALAAGEVLGVQGPNGAGKSSLLLGVAGLASAQSGRIELDGVSLAGNDAVKRFRLGIASSLQGARVFGGLTVGEHFLLARGRRWKRGGGPEWIRSIVAVLPVLADRRQVRARDLSGGERQLLAIAMALATQPRLLLLDEPLAGLSTEATEAVLQLVRHWLKQSGCSVLIAEHRIDETAAFCGRWLKLAQGSMVRAIVVNDDQSSVPRVS